MKIREIENSNIRKSPKFIFRLEKLKNDRSKNAESVNVEIEKLRTREIEKLKI